jgi:hypothetical protein
MYPRLCALSDKSLGAGPFQIFRLMRLCLLDIRHMLVMLEFGHAVDAENSMLALRYLALLQGLTPTKAGNCDCYE